MSNDIEIIDIEEDLDYELDVDMDEDELLQDDNCGNEGELVKQMSSLTSVEQSEPIAMAAAPSEALITLSEPLPLPNTVVQGASDFWNKSISTFANLLQKSPTKPTETVAIEPNETVTMSPFEMFKKRAHENLNMEEKKMEAVEMKVDDMNLEEKKGQEGTESEPNSFFNGNNIATAIVKMGLTASETQQLSPIVQKRVPIEAPVSDNVEMKLPEIRATKSSSSCTSSSSSPSKSPMKNRNKNRRRKLLPNRKRMQNISEQFNHQTSGIRSLMSMNTTEAAFSHGKIPPILNPVNVLIGSSVISIPAAKASNKVPFFIQTQSGGLPRTVVPNPLFSGFSNQSTNQSSIVRKRVRAEDRAESESGTSPIGKHRNAVINKRRPITPVESIAKSEPKRVLPQVIVSEEMSDDDKRYLLEIEKQKAQREEVLRMKEWKRDAEGWQFLD